MLAAAMKSTFHIIAMVCACCLIISFQPSEIRTHYIHVNLNNGAKYEIFVYRKPSVGWYGVNENRVPERELLDVTVPIELTRHKIFVGNNASWMSKTRVYCINSYNSIKWTVTDWWTGIVDGYNKYKQEQEFRGYEINYETVGIDIKRNGSPIEIPGDIGNRTFLSVKEMELQNVQLYLAINSGGRYDAEDFFAIDFVDGLETIIVGKYKLHLLDGKLVRIIGGRGEYDELLGPQLTRRLNGSP